MDEGLARVCEDSRAFKAFQSRFAVKEKRRMAVEKVNASSSLAEVVDRILDKGVVVDAWARVSLVGIELLAVEARVVVAGVDTYLKYAEAVGLTAGAQAA
ncbi:MAG: gas vesicle structural protein GvpA [Kiloniellales bacterium]|nr:gas vesicle structural protein GvpA [Kiloniellales bacterium]